MIMQIHCCECAGNVDAVLTSGREVYQHRADLYGLPFWKCPHCGNFVGCHHKTKNRTNPLGVIPKKEIKELRKRIHATLDPMWQGTKRKNHNRNRIYKIISDKFGWKYHTAKIKTEEEGVAILEYVKSIKLDFEAGVL